MNDLVQNYTAVLRKYADFGGRARRREYWMFLLANFLVGIVFGIVTLVLGRTLGNGLSALFNLAVLIPSIAVGVRRLHDTGRSGWWMLVALTGIGTLLLLFFFVQDSQAGVNEYGPNPKELAFAYA